MVRIRYKLELLLGAFVIGSAIGQLRECCRTNYDPLYYQPGQLMIYSEDTNGDSLTETYLLITEIDGTQKTVGLEKSTLEKIAQEEK